MVILDGYTYRVTGHMLPSKTIELIDIWIEVDSHSDPKIADISSGLVSGRDICFVEGLYFKVHDTRMEGDNHFVLHVIEISRAEAVG